MRAGNLRHKIKILKEEAVKNSTGETETKSLVLVGVIKAGLLNSSVNNDFVASGQISPFVKTFQIRFIDWLDMSHVIEFQGQTYRILNIDNVNGRNRELRVYTETET